MNKANPIDLDKNQRALLDKIIKRQIPNKTVWAYGSRVTWKANEISDLDLVVFDCASTEIFDLKESFEESALLISVDVMDWGSIPDNFKENIKSEYVVLQEKSELEGWREVKLGEIANINPTERLLQGTVAKKVAMEALQPFTKKIPSFLLEEYNGGVKFKNGDTVMARITPSLENGKTSYVDILGDGEIGYGSTEFIVLREKENISDKHFLYYLAISSEIRDIAILSMTGSSGRQRVQADVVKEHELLLPPLPEQKAIAEILSSHDDKIDLLHRQNKTLEQMAETLFRQWFVEEADERWDRCMIKDLCIKATSGGTPRTTNKKYYNGNINWYSTKELKDNFLFGSQTKITKIGLTNSSAKMFPKGTVLIAIYAAPTVGRMGILANESTFNQAACGLVANDEICCKEFLYIYLKLERPNLHAIATGSAQQNLNVAKITSYPIFIPDKDTMQIFKSSVQPLFNKIEQNGNQIRTLENLRDILLPKLMSGAIGLNYE